VSTTEQADSGAGLAAQQASIEREAAHRGWDLAPILTETGSGKSLSGRPALASALEALGAGEAQVLVVSKLDRLSRSLLDFAGLMGRAQSEGWNLVALDLGIDLSTPGGEFLASVMASAAQWERRIIGQRTKEALAVKRAQGVRLGRPPSIPPKVRQRVMAERADGRTYKGIAETLNAEGVPTSRGGVCWYPATVRQVVVADTNRPG
jgi:DNA invertase Pin-like site-specific DNA recombinase